MTPTAHRPHALTRITLMATSANDACVNAVTMSVTKVLAIARNGRRPPSVRITVVTANDDTVATSRRATTAANHDRIEPGLLESSRVHAFIATPSPNASCARLNEILIGGRRSANSAHSAPTIRLDSSAVGPSSNTPI